MRLSGNPLLDYAARSYVFVFRGTPLLVQIFLIYYGLGQFPEIRQSFLWPFLREPYWCALLALTLNTAAYCSEIIRGGILSVPFGQIEAARACGMSRSLIFRRIIVPQGLHRRAARLRQRDHPDDPLDGARLDDHADGSDRDRFQDHRARRSAPSRSSSARARSTSSSTSRSRARSRSSSGGSRRNSAHRRRPRQCRSAHDGAGLERPARGQRDATCASASARSKS